MEVVMKRPKQSIKIILFIVFLLVLASIPALNVKAENAQSTAPSMKPEKANGSAVLFDNTHGQTAGAADWVIDGGFSDYASGLVGEGFSVTELRKNSAICYSDLEKYDVFVIPEANIPFKSSEQDAILKYVKQGGSVFFIADHYNADRNKNRWDASEVFNGYRRGAYLEPTKGMSSAEANSSAMKGVTSSDWLAENFGVRFRYNALGDLNATQVVKEGECFQITQNVDSVAMHAGSTVAIINPDIAKGIVYVPSGLSSDQKWSSAVDDGIYDGGGIKEGAYVAIAKVGQGKAAFIGDSSAVEDATPKYKKEENGGTKKTYDGYLEQDDATLLLQLTDWLSEQEDYTSFSEKGIPLDTKTQLHNFENPEDSVEIQSEPWATPASDYKWYDQNTFKAGSYGYTGNAGNEDSQPEEKEQTYTIGLPQTIVVGEELPLTIYFNGLSANTTYDGFKVGAYLNGGKQVGYFSNLDGKYQNQAGYSSSFSITTDQDGNASKVFAVKIDKSVTDTFFLRLKKGSKNLITNSCSISEYSNNKYQLNVPTVAKAGQETAVTIRINGLIADQTLSTMKIGSYLDGGTQVGLFLIDGVTWTSQYGYSDPFSLQADENGIITKTIRMKLKPGISGDVNLRLKQGSKKMVTVKITVQ
ncbi:hypothetical protein lbkm_4198 [Lachnospiraceae bacterium KM106-2]|nr:hypothetical protein lbkm_4198 [Lachnospiraceae bacterium KM106-2]